MANPNNEESDSEEALYPFYHVSDNLLEGATVRAGFMTEAGEIEYLVMDMTDVGVGRVEQAFGLAFGWYVDQLNRASAAAEQQADDAESNVIKADG